MRLPAPSTETAIASARPSHLFNVDSTNDMTRSVSQPFVDNVQDVELVISVKDFSDYIQIDAEHWLPTSHGNVLDFSQVP